MRKWCIEIGPYLSSQGPPLLYLDFSYTGFDNRADRSGLKEASYEVPLPFEVLDDEYDVAARSATNLRFPNSSIGLIIFNGAFSGQSREVAEAYIKEVRRLLETQADAGSLFVVIETGPKPFSFGMLQRLCMNQRFLLVERIGFESRRFPDEAVNFHLGERAIWEDRVHQFIKTNRDDSDQYIAYFYPLPD